MMLYYVKTGSVDVSLHAASHRQAASRAIRSYEKDCGVCVVVSDRKIAEENSDRNVYFLTETILERSSIRLVS